MTSWIRNYHAAPDAPVRLLCLPHAGGAANFYHPWSKALQREVQVLSVQYPGRHDRWREPLPDDVRTVADAVAAEILRDGDRRPTALFGHSMGATVAFEIAGRMERSGLNPAVVVVSGRTPPPVASRRPVHQLDDGRLLAELERLGGGESVLSSAPELRDMVLPIVRADFKMIETYVHRPADPLRSPIAALVGADDPLVTPRDLDGWADMTSGGFAASVLPGGHFYLSRDDDMVLTEIFRLARTLSSVMPPVAAGR